MSVDTQTIKNLKLAVPTHKAGEHFTTSNKSWGGGLGMMVDHRVYIGREYTPSPPQKIYIYMYKATICCILVSHQGLSPTFMRAGGYYHYTIIHPPRKRAIAISLSVQFLHSRSYVCQIELPTVALEGDISELFYSKSTYRWTRTQHEVTKPTAHVQ